MIQDVIELTENSGSILEGFGNGMEFYQTLTQTHPNLVAHLMVNAKLNFILYGEEMAETMLKTSLFMIYLLFISNEKDDTEELKNKLNDDDINSLNEILGKL